MSENALPRDIPPLPQTANVGLSVSIFWLFGSQSVLKLYPIPALRKHTMKQCSTWRGPRCREMPQRFIRTFYQTKVLDDNARACVHKAISIQFASTTPYLAKITSQTITFAAKQNKAGMCFPFPYYTDNTSQDCVWTKHACPKWDLFHNQLYKMLIW